MEEKCPGLPDWEALKQCTEVLATAETFPKGRILSYPADWGTRSADMITGLALHYEAVPAGRDGALVARAKKRHYPSGSASHDVLAAALGIGRRRCGVGADAEVGSEVRGRRGVGPNSNAVNDRGVDIAITFKVA